MAQSYLSEANNHWSDWVLEVKTEKWLAQFVKLTGTNVRHIATEPM